MGARLVTAAFDTVLAGTPTRMLRDDGTECALAPQRWHAPAAGDDGWLLDRCVGPALDLGCGPGRLVEALDRRGVRALGVDVSATAEAQCRRRRAAVLRRDVFAPLPAEGRWRHVLLADGNIGIGGDPLRLLRRARSLLQPGGTVLVETHRSPGTYWTGTVRLHTADEVGAPLPWAEVGREALTGLAAALGMPTTATHDGDRSFAELTRP